MRLYSRKIDVGARCRGSELPVKSAESTLGIASTEDGCPCIAIKHFGTEMFGLLSIQLSCAATLHPFSVLDNANARCQQRPNWRGFRPVGPAGDQPSEGPWKSRLA
jgi:hypothetical protein